MVSKSMCWYQHVILWHVELTQGMTPYLDDRGDEATVRHGDGNGNVDVLVVCDTLAISRARCKKSHKHSNGFVAKALDCCGHRCSLHYLLQGRQRTSKSYSVSMCRQPVAVLRNPAVKQGSRSLTECIRQTNEVDVPAAGCVEILSATQARSAVHHNTAGSNGGCLQTCIQHRMLRQSNASCLCKQTRHGDALGLEPLIQGIQGICVDAVCHSELWDLHCSKTVYRH